MTGSARSEESPDDRDEVLEAGAREPRWSPPARRWRVAFWMLGVIAAVVAVGFGVLGGTHSTPRPSARVAPTSTPDVAAVPRVPSARSLATRSVLALAHHAGPLTDYVRQTSPAGACVMVAPGGAPVRSIERALHRSVRGFTVSDVGRTLDEFTGLCSVQVRARSPRGATLALSISAPPAGQLWGPPEQVRTGTSPDGRSATIYVSSVSRSGWSVLVGVTGAHRDLPGARALRHLTQQPGLLW